MYYSRFIPLVLLLTIWARTRGMHADSRLIIATSPLRRREGGGRFLQDCGNECNDGKENGYSSIKFTKQEAINHPRENIDIVTTYIDTSGVIRTSNIRSRDLSDSWVWKKHIDNNHGHVNHQDIWGLDPKIINTEENDNPIHNEHLWQYQQKMTPVKLLRRENRKKRKENRTAILVVQDKEFEHQMQDATIERSKQMNTTRRAKYNIWKREYVSTISNDILKLMRDQIIMAKAYASIAWSKSQLDLYNSLMKHVQENQFSIREANSDSELPPSAVEQAKAMGHVLSLAKDMLYDCATMTRKLRVMLQSTEENTNTVKKQNAFLIQLMAKTVPTHLHCLSLHLTTDYHMQNHGFRQVQDMDKLVDLSLYHYAIFSDNVLATSVVINSTISNAKEPEKHVFHVVTDKLNFAAMKMWFLVSSPEGATIQIENIDDFKWLNSSYCSVLRQLESAQLKAYYFKSNNPSSLSAGTDNLKYRNPKYLSMLNHLRFYLPEVYPKLDKILFLDDDIVVQKDLSSLWSIDLQGKVNGAVETCKQSFHRFDKYLNFSNPKISQNFDPNSCGWAFGMNMFDLNEWKKRDITGIYHRWQDLNEDRTLWKLGSLPPGLITFYNLTHPLDRNWHVLGLGYDPALNQTEIENAAVVHYNGNYKPWLDLAITKYKKYWSKFVKPDNPYLHRCKIHQ